VSGAGRRPGWWAQMLLIGVVYEVHRLVRAHIAGSAAAAAFDLGWVLVPGLAGFAVYPLAPPRLLPARYGFVDTVQAVGGVGPVGSKTETPKTGNPYAAMLFAVVVTGNHYFLDAVGGWAALAVAFAAERLRRRWQHGQ